MIKNKVFKILTVIFMFMSVFAFNPVREVRAEEEFTTKYAVQIYGIEQDELEDGSTAGLTFGPALGQDFMNTYISHTPTGTTSSGHAHRCVHNDSWETIARWNFQDPYVYEQCVAENCTHSVNLTFPDYLKNTSFVYGGSSSGDGVGILYEEFNNVGHRSWNPINNGANYGTNKDGWGASRIRAMMNGYDSLTMTKGSYSYYSYLSSIDPVENYTGDNTLLSAFPEILQDNIGARKTLYDSVYNSKTAANLKTSYDKLWLLSPNEMSDSISATTHNHPLEAPNGKYQKFVENNINLSSSSYNGAFRAFAQSGVKLVTSGRSDGWWLRSSYGSQASMALYVEDSGDVQNYNACNGLGVSPCFSLDRLYVPSYDPADPLYDPQADEVNYTTKRGINANNDWVKNGNTWTYTFDVFDDSIPYYIWEDKISGYTSDVMKPEKGYFNQNGERYYEIINRSTTLGNLKISKFVDESAQQQGGSSVQTNEKIIGDNYVIHSDDIATYTIDIANRPSASSYTIRNQNTGNMVAKESNNNGVASSVGVSNRNNFSSITGVTILNGEPYVYYPRAAKDSSGNYKDVWIKYSNTTIYPESTINPSTSVQLFHGLMNNKPAFAMVKENGELRTQTPYGVTTTATIYITDLAGSASGSATTAPTFTTISGDETVIINASNLNQTYSSGSNLPQAGDFNNFTSKATIDGKSSTGSFISVASSAASTEISLVGFNGSITYLLDNLDHAVKTSVGSSGKAQITTTGLWKTDGTVPDDAKILLAGQNDTSKTYYATDGKTITYKLTPDETHQLDTLTVNNVDVTNDVVEGDGFYYYTLSNITRDTTVNITWKTGTPPGKVVPEPEKFDFIITLEGNNLSGVKTYSGVVFTDGVGRIKLADGETKLIEGLPAGTTYTIEEVPSIDYTVTSTGDTGTIVSGETAEAEFNNKLKVLILDEESTNIILKKTVTGNNEIDNTYHFFVVFNNLGANKRITLSDGTVLHADAAGSLVYECDLANGDELMFRGIPLDATYQISENAGEYISSYQITDANDSGTINQSANENTAENTALTTAVETADIGEKITVEFTNHVIRKQNLKIQKEVIGKTEDKAQKYEITVELYDMSPLSTLESDAGRFVSDEDGYAIKTILMEDGQEFIIPEIPVGVQYIITEGKNNCYASYTITDENGGNNIVNASKANSQVDSILATQMETVNEDEEATVKFTNTSEITVTLKKQVDGNMGNKTDEFDFSSTIIWPELYAAEPTDATTGIITAPVLSHDDTVEYKAPYGSTYSFSEEDYSSSGYRTYVGNSMIQGRETTGTFDQDKEIKFRNINGAAVPTEIRFWWWAPIPVMAMPLIWFIYKRRRKSITE